MTSERPATTSGIQRLSLCVLLAAAAEPGLCREKVEADEGRGADSAVESIAGLGHRWISYGEKGIEFNTPGGNTSIWFGFRTQLRYTTLESVEVVSDTASGFPGQGILTTRSLRTAGDEFDLNRARFKTGGHLFRTWIQPYSEVDLRGGMWLDYRATFVFDERFKIRVGQWKSEFNRERIDSSGKQQLVDRSIVNPWITLDRQQGVGVMGRLGAGERWDSSYWLEMLSGTGLGGTWNAGDRLWLARYQWNVFGRELAFSQGDLDRHSEPVAAVSAGFVGGDSRFTRWGSSGGGQLPGLEGGSPGQFRIRQAMLETAYHHRGFSWQNEWHWKQAHDRGTGSTRELWGGYAQAGYFLHESIPAVPKPLEVVGRFALVDPDRAVESNLLREWTIGLNWYFRGHRNKITTDVSRLDADDGAAGGLSETRFRVQWDFSF